MMLEFDQKLAEQMEVVYRSRDILRRRRHVYDLLGAAPGDRVVDVGCGPGFFVAELLDQVGSDGYVAGVDASPQMLGVAAHRSEGRSNVAFHQGEATALPVQDGSFDRALSVQVLEYVDDVEGALRQIHRTLRPGGRAVIWDVDWATVSWHSTEPDRMRRVLRAWDRHLAHPSLPTSLAPLMRATGFQDVEMQAHAFATTELSSDAYGSAIMPLMHDYVSGLDEVGPDEAHAWAAEQHDLNERGEFYFACIQFGFAGTRGG
jgi:arsenite methyltransferase